MANNVTAIDSIAGFNLLNYNVITMSLAQTYRGDTVFVLRDWGQYHPPPSAEKLGCNTDLRPSAVGLYCPIFQPPGIGMVLPPISQDSDGIPRYVLARLTIFYQSRANM